MEFVFGDGYYASSTYMDNAVAIYEYVLGEDVTEFFRRGVEKTMEKLAGQNIDLAILQPRSPSCGCKKIYDGTFTKTLIDGKGMFAQALAEAGIPMMDEEDL